MDTTNRQPIRLEDIASVDDLKLAMDGVFERAQHRLSDHSGLARSMTSIFKKALLFRLQKHFTLDFKLAVNGLLSSGKGEQGGDRLIEFITLFVSLLNKCTETEAKHANGFLRNLIRHLLQGARSKNSNVRYRVVQMLANLLCHYVDIDLVTLKNLYHSLRKCVSDKDFNIRLEAVVAFSQLQVFDFSFAESDRKSNVSEEKLRDILIKVMTKDPNDEVRRAAMLHLEKLKHTGPLLNAQAGDVSSISRQRVYSRTVAEVDEYISSHHPGLRNGVLHWGSNDRDEYIKKEATKLLCNHWYNSANKDFLTLIAQLDLTTEGDVASQAIIQIFTEMPQELEQLNIDAYYWRKLSVEKAFFLRVLHDYCIANDLKHVIERHFPDSLVFARALKKAFRRRLHHMLDSTGYVHDQYVQEMEMERIMNESMVVEENISKVKYEIGEQKRICEDCTLSITALEPKIKYVATRLGQVNLPHIPSSADDEDTEDDDEESNDRDNTLSAEFDRGKNYHTTLSEKDLMDENTKLTRLLKQRQSVLDESTRKMNGLVREYHESKRKFRKLEVERVAKIDYDEKHQSYNEKLSQNEQVLNQLLLIAKDFDFGDNVGRSRISRMIRCALEENDLSDVLTESSVKVLRAISIDEDDFLYMATKIITDIRDDTEETDDSYYTLSSAAYYGEDGDSEDDLAHKTAQQGSETNHQCTLAVMAGQEGNRAPEEDRNLEEDGPPIKKQRVDPARPSHTTVAKCLTIAAYVLQLTKTSLEKDASHKSIYHDLVMLAIHQDTHYILKILGVRCLGLFALIDRTIAYDAVGWIHDNICFAGEEILATGLLAAFDIFTSYGPEIAQEFWLHQYSRLFYKYLNTPGRPEVQCIVGKGLCRLFLANFFDSSAFDGAQIGLPIDNYVSRKSGRSWAVDNTDNDSSESEENDDGYSLAESAKRCLQALVVSHFNPQIETNKELRQILAFCLPKYAFGHPMHQERLRAVTGTSFKRMTEYGEEFFTGSLLCDSVLKKLIDWCDPQNLVDQTPEAVAKNPSHVWLCIDLVQLLTMGTVPKLVRKSIISNLSQFHLSLHVASRTLKALKLKLAQAKSVMIEEKVEFDWISTSKYGRFMVVVHRKWEKLFAREADASRE